jgi:dihydroorotate dehydrogenase (fumarate)
MVDLSTRYLGLTLQHPIVPSASPLSRTLDGVRRLEDAGAPAIVLYSLFEEEIEREYNLREHVFTLGADSHAEALRYFPPQPPGQPDHYLEHIRLAKSATNIPIIASLNGVTVSGWIDFAKRIEQAGADALELNVFLIPTNPILTGEFVEAHYIELDSTVSRSVRIPVSIKLAPFFSATANMAQRLVDSGARGLVMFNRFYQPDIDIEQLYVTPNLHLSTSDELRLPLRWAAILYGQMKADLAITGGVHSHFDVIKSLMAGANVAMTASELLQNGVGRIGEMASALRMWLDEHDYISVRQMIGSVSQRNVALPQAYVRANYMRMLDSWRGGPGWETRAGEVLYDGLLAESDE